MKRRKSLKAFAVVCCLLLCMVAMAVQTFGYVPVDTEREASLTLTFGTEETVFSGVKFRVYYLGNETVNVTDAENYIKENVIAPLDEKTTDADGIVTFAGLQNGLYLIVGDSYRTETEIYTPVSVVVALPQLVPELDTWDYEVVANVKYTIAPAELPQTGQLWWPVMFVVPGATLVVAGCAALRKEKRA